MRIEAINNAILNESAKKPASRTTPDGHPIEDKADIRDQSSNINEARSIIDTSPETRDQLVQQIRQDILSGDYEINLRNIAEKLYEYHTQDLK